MPRALTPRSPTVSGLRKARRRIERRSLTYLGRLGVLEQIDSWTQLLLDCHHYSAVKSSNDLYFEAYTALSSVALAQLEAGRWLLLNGFYGSLLATVRALATQNDLLSDLSADSAAPGRWLALRAYALDDNSNRARKAHAYFKDSAIRKRLEARGEPSLAAGIYGVASHAVHTTSPGSRFFLSESLAVPGRLNVYHRPEYNPESALSHAVLFLATQPHLCGFFLQRCDRNRPGDASLDSLARRHFQLLQRYEERSHRWRVLLAVLESARDRVAAGESWDSVLSGLEPTFK